MRAAWFVRIGAGFLALTLACYAQTDTDPPKADPFGDLLSTLPAITQAATEAATYEVREGERTVGWGRMDIETKPDASGGAYLLREHFVFQTVEGGETISATIEAEVDARFRPKRVLIEQAVKSGANFAKASDLLQAEERGFKMSHMDDGGEPILRSSGFPSRPYVVGIEFLLPKLAREKLDGAVIVELDPQAAQTSERKVRVFGLPQGRASIVVKDVDGEREATYTVDAKGQIEWIQQGTLVFRTCTVDRWEKLRKQFPDVE
ncbi:MAG: hypothetical protein AAB434_08810 [Planctomycetota bacterium]